jgi:hypothetical protein
VSDSSTVTRRRVAAWLETDRGAALATFGAALVVYALTASWTRIHNSDVYASVVPAIQAAQTGTVWLEGTPWADTSPFFDRVGDHVVSDRQVGIIMLAVPFYALFGAPDDVWPSVLAVVVAAAGTVTMLHLAIRRHVTPAAGWAATAVLAFGTPTWAVSADGLWSHTATQLAIAAAAVALSRDRWWLAGAALGAGTLARPHLAVIALVVGLGMSWSRRNPRIAIAVGVPATLGLASLVGLNRWIYGRWTVSAYKSYATDNLAGGFGEWYDPLLNVAGFLIAPDRGLFIWTPIALVLLPAVWRIRGSAPTWTIWLTVGGLAYTAVQLRINHFHGVDAFFGYRHPLELVTCAFALYAVAWSSVRSARLRGVVASLAVLQIAAMALGAVRSDGLLGVDEVWRDNSLLVVLRMEPLVMAPLMLVILALAVRVGLDVYRRSASASENQR